MQLPKTPSYKRPSEAARTSQPSTTTAEQTVELDVAELERDTSGSEYDTDTSSNLAPPPPYVEISQEPEGQDNMARISSYRSNTSTKSHRRRRRRERSRSQDRSTREIGDHFVISRDEMPKQEQNRAILVLGATGAGKSSFIASATGLNVNIGHSLDPCTVDPKGWRYTYKDDPEITLIDTPGFNDQRRKDTDLLESIVDYIGRKNLSIIGIIYLLRITERKLTGSTMINLRLLRAMCGEHYFQNVVLATSMWETVPASEMDETKAREVQFNTSPAFWADMLDKGAEYFRWDDTGAVEGSRTAQAITSFCKNKRHPPPPNIMLDIGKGVKLEDTAAYRILTEELRRRLEREREALLEEEERISHLQLQRAELQRLVGREQEGVRKESAALERAQNAAMGPRFMNPLASFAWPRQRRFSETETPAGVRMLDAGRERRYSVGEGWETSQSGSARDETRRYEGVRDEDSHVIQHRRRRHRSPPQYVCGLAWVRRHR